MSKLDDIIDSTRADAIFWADGHGGDNTNVDEKMAKLNIKGLMYSMLADSLRECREAGKLAGSDLSASLRKKIEEL